LGRYYALADGEPAAVADAIQSHYQPRFNGDALPQGPVACAVALADKLDALIGFFGIGQIPTGDKVPSACAAPRWACCASSWIRRWRSRCRS